MQQLLHNKIQITSVIYLNSILKSLFLFQRPSWRSALRSISFFKRGQKEIEEVEKEVEQAIADTDRRKVSRYDGYLVKDRLHTLQSNR